jgi:hypothetical protein
MASHYSFMKAGLHDAPKGIDPVFVVNVEALVYTLVGHAAESACKYAKHSGRHRASINDVFSALRYQVRRFLHYDALERDVRRTAEILDALAQEDPEDTAESDAESAESEEAEHGGLHEACRCDFCGAVEATNESWNAWQPNDPAEAFLKRKVDETVARFATI